MHETYLFIHTSNMGHIHFYMYLVHTLILIIINKISLEDFELFIHTDKIVSKSFSHADLIESNSSTFDLLFIKCIIVEERHELSHLLLSR